MTEAEVPQPISSLPTRWGSFTGHQLSWLGLAAAPPYLLLRAHLPLLEVAIIATPWALTASVIAFGRYRGRQIDHFLGDWAMFHLHPRVMDHPDSGGRSREVQFTSVDSQGMAPLPWKLP
jgi:hypothetical protein